MSSKIEQFFSKRNPARVLILTDSRGKGIQEFFDSYVNEHDLPLVCKFEIVKGAKLQRLYHIALREDRSYRFDKILIIGGICNFTTRESYNSIRILSYYSTDQIDKFLQILTKLRDHFGSRVNIATVVPASLTQYYKYHLTEEDPLEQGTLLALKSQQSKLLDDLKVVNVKIVEDNKLFGNRTIDLDRQVIGQSVKKRKRGKPQTVKIEFKEQLLTDGVHPNDSLKKRLHKRTLDSLLRELGLFPSSISKRTESDTSEEELDNWDFKRVSTA